MHHPLPRLSTSPPTLPLLFSIVLSCRPRPQYESSRIAALAASSLRFNTQPSAGRARDTSSFMHRSVRSFNRMSSFAVSENVPERSAMHRLDLVDKNAVQHCVIRMLAGQIPEQCNLRCTHSTPTVLFLNHTSPPLFCCRRSHPTITWYRFRSLQASPNTLNRSPQPLSDPLSFFDFVSNQ